ncbi:endolytic transglycosylase MltG [Hyphomonas sp. FCG-A18]|uniref:endolytic transglycosylase MltG n=1 Tax=Hyphomonas sp. FCG-A18 TaxID=3080019 RepID=UPI002B325EE8|nr:endolytic transglycosylase MltG [Hyphomonas sp. FCG-A18]
MRFLKSLIAFIFVLTVLATAAGLGGWIWFNDQVSRPGPLMVPTEFTVDRGEGLASVAAKLEAEGIIKRRQLLQLKARIDETETAIKAGTYAIPAGVSIVSLLDQLVEGEVIQLRLTIPEGLTTAQILRRVEAADVLSGDMPEREIGEGVLLPDTYVFGTGTTREQFISRMETAQDRLLERLWEERQEGLPLQTPYEAVTLASVVEKETGIDGERGKVAGLFVGRLKKGMRLESDPTIIYGVSQGEPLYNRQGQRRTLYRSEIDRKTDWNTYQIDGLPKTPICNPGRDAIEAVLNPPDTDYVFFVADGKGGHLFAKTYEEHQRNVAKYREFERQEIARERGN